MPRKIKHRKYHRGRIKGQAQAGNYVAFGEFGLQSLEAGWITANQIEAARVAANRVMAGTGKMWIRVFPNTSASARPAETRMGKGKGEPAYWYARIKPGTILFEIGGTTEEIAKKAFLRQAHKFPVKTCLARRRQPV
jgi:large subunit ribosomal protein L16